MDERKEEKNEQKSQSFVDKLKATWGKWTVLQKGVFFGVIVAAIIVLLLIVRVSSRPTSVAVIDTPVTDIEMRERIQLRINKENVHSTVAEDGMIYVSNEADAKRIRSILIREDLIPQGTDAWDLFDIERYTITDYERDVNKRRAIIREITQHIKALDEIDDASVIVNIPKDKLFKADQNPVTASVVIFPKPGSNITSDKKKLEGIQKIIKFGIEGLEDENISIADQNGNILNDFAGMADFDRLTLIDKQQKAVQRYEAKYEAKILGSLQQTYGTDRVRDLNIKIEMDMSEVTAETLEYIPFVLREDNPDTVYDDSDIRESVTVSSESASTTWQGTGFNPEGPAGVEGQTAPAYKDMTNLAGLSTQTVVKTNEKIGERKTSEIVSPELGRRTVSVNIDGVWKKKKDENGNYIIKDGMIEREYIPISEEQLRDTEKSIRDAIGYDATRKDSVTVTNIPFDRLKQFEEEDRAYFAAMQRRTIILISLAGLALVLLIFILYRIISRELERRKRLREEEALRQAQLERQKAIWEDEQGKVVTISMAERRRMELQENAINMAREHPEDVAMLIRTWLMEE
ncbi:MAG: flagellar M-ring protein FliF [Treponema sp.]|nr:MAG: flagellar M-ring protein FliF [Treponema sp.]